MGVKFKPYRSSIPIFNLVIPLLNNLIGVFNDIINHFMNSVELKIIQLPQEKMKLCNDTTTIDAQVKELGNAATKWRISTDGGR